MPVINQTLWGPIAAAALAALLLGPRASGAAPAATADDSSAANSLLAAVRTLSSERAGFTAFHRHVDAQQRAPGHNASLDVQAGLLRDGNSVIAVKLYSRTANGATASADDLAKAQADADKSLATNDYVLPLREDRLADYRVANATCDQCAAGSQAIRFTSIKRDPSHGDGTVVIDSTTHHILSVDFVPSALPKHVDSASVTLTFERVLPDLWDETDMHEHYTGHVLFISGGAEIVTTLSGYRRFASRDEGVKALATGI
jgi:hypothetical protein